MGIADRDYMRERKLQWDDSRAEMRLDDREPPRAPGFGSWFGWLAIIAAVVGLAGTGVWWTRHSTAVAQGGSASEVFPDNPVLVGRVTKVIDGDTIVVALGSGPMHVRFDSIDAPEKNQPWGLKAKEALTGKLDHREVALDVMEQKDHYDRMVAVVYLGDENVNAWMVKQGHAWAYRDYLKDQRYCAAEGDARSARRGLWALPPNQRHAPWDWRAVERGRADAFTDYSHETVTNCIAAMKKRGAGMPKALPVVAASSARLAVPVSGKCLIKGNISSSGRIYHVPGSASYEKTVITESKGERWFCTEEEARAAGWRAPR